MIKIPFDTESTGLLKPEANDLAEQPEIIEIYCVKIDENFEVLGEFNSFIRPTNPISEKITEITGITNEMVADAPDFAFVYQELAEFFKGADEMIAHNLPFDRSMVANELLRIDKLLQFPWPIKHTCTIEKSMPIEQRRMNLTNLHKHFFNKGFDAHRAKNDVHALVRCYHAMSESGKFNL